MDERWDTRNERWMEDNSEVLEVLSLSELTIPGTHDAGTCGVKDGGLVRSWAKAQDVRFPEQLSAGIRYFDLRVKHNNLVTYARAQDPAQGRDPDLKFFHGAVDSSERLDPFLQAVKSFITSHRKEVVILHFAQLKHGTTDHDRRKIIQLLYSRLGPEVLLAPEGTHPARITLEQVWSTDQRVIVFWEGPKPDLATVYKEHQCVLDCLWVVGPGQPSDTLMCGGWANTDSSKALREQLRKDVWSTKTGAPAYEAAHSGAGFLRLQAVLTPGARDTIYVPHVLATLARSVNRCVYEWLSTGRALEEDPKGATTMHDVGAIVSVDYFENFGGDRKNDTRFVDAIVDLNRSRARHKLDQTVPRTPALSRDPGISIANTARQ